MFACTFSDGHNSSAKITRGLNLIGWCFHTFDLNLLIVFVSVAFMVSESMVLLPVGHYSLTKGVFGFINLRKSVTYFFVMVSVGGTLLIWIGYYIGSAI